jgi:hypothetical protein
MQVHIDANQEGSIFPIAWMNASNHVLFEEVGG